MRTIHKFLLEPIIEADANAEWLTVQIQHGEAYVWALVDDSAMKVEHCLRIACTGHNCFGLKSEDHIGTFQFPAKGLVFHVFRPENP